MLKFENTSLTWAKGNLLLYNHTYLPCAPNTTIFASIVFMIMKIRTQEFKELFTLKRHYSLTKFIIWNIPPSQLWQLLITTIQCNFKDYTNQRYFTTLTILNKLNIVRSSSPPPPPPSSSIYRLTNYYFFFV